MKKINLLIMLMFLAGLGLGSCNNQKTYAEMKEEEADAIQKYILENDIKVISEEEFVKNDSVTGENEYALFEESGIYMNIVTRGDGEVLTKGNYTILARFVEIALQTQKDRFEEGDTLLGNMHMNDRPTLMLTPEVMKVTIDTDSYTGSFSVNDGPSLMNEMYQTSAIPAGWMFPLRFIKPNRTKDSKKIARVKIIVPHSQGTSTAQQYVYPCFYELTYQLD